jgi:hypothetical protein
MIVLCVAVATMSLTLTGIYFALGCHKARP